MFLPEEVDWQFHNQLQPKFLFLPCYKYFTKSVFNLQGLSQSDWGSYELDVHHFLPLLVLDSSHRSAKMLEVRKKICLWSQKVVHFTFHSFDSISLKQTYCILYGKYCSVKCRRRIRKFLQKKILSERIFLVIHTKSYFRPPLISSVI